MRQCNMLEAENRANLSTLFSSVTFEQAARQTLRYLVFYVHDSSINQLLLYGSLFWLLFMVRKQTLLLCL